MTTEPKAEGGEAVPVKTVIVYGDHGPEEREPVEDYYDAPPTPTTPAVEALARAASVVYDTYDNVLTDTQEMWDALQAALAHPEIAALLGETK